MYMYIVHKLQNILIQIRHLKTNEKFKIQKEKELLTGEESKYANDLLNYLQYHIVTYCSLCTLVIEATSKVRRQSHEC